MRVDLTKYIGKSHDEYDCYGLFRAIQSELGHDLPSFEPDNNPRSVSNKIGIEALKRYVKLKEPKEWCAVIMMNRGIPSHIACYIGEGRIIHSTSERGVTIDDMDIRDVVGFYGVRK